MSTTTLFPDDKYELFDQLCHQQFPHDALIFLREHGNRASLEYLWYEGFLQATLGWDEEALMSLERYKRSEPDGDLLGVTSGLLADIHHNAGNLYDASEEIKLALELLPDDPDILRKAQEIFDDIDDTFKGIILAILIAGLLSKPISKT